MDNVFTHIELRLGNFRKDMTCSTDGGMACKGQLLIGCVNVDGPFVSQIFLAFMQENCFRVIELFGNDLLLALSRSGRQRNVLTMANGLPSNLVCVKTSIVAKLSPLGSHPIFRLDVIKISRGLV
jgi:hypothetical protein